MTGAAASHAIDVADMSAETTLANELTADSLADLSEMAMEQNDVISLMMIDRMDN